MNVKEYKRKEFRRKAERYCENIPALIEGIVAAVGIAWLLLVALPLIIR